MKETGESRLAMSKDAMLQDAMNKKPRIFKIAARAFMVLFVLVISIFFIVIYASLPDELVLIGTHYYPVALFMRGGLFSGFILGMIYMIAFQSFSKMIKK